MNGVATYEFNCLLGQMLVFGDSDCSSGQKQLPGGVP